MSLHQVRVRFVLPDGTTLTRGLHAVPDTGHLVRLERDGVVYVAAPPEHLVGGLPYVTIRLTPAFEHRDAEVTDGLRDPETDEVRPIGPAFTRFRDTLEAIRLHGSMPAGESWEVAYEQIVELAKTALAKEGIV